MHGVKGVAFACVNNRQSSSTCGAHNAHHIKLHMIIYSFAWRARIILKRFIIFLPSIAAMPTQTNWALEYNHSFVAIHAIGEPSESDWQGKFNANRGKKVERKKNPKMAWKLDLTVHNSNRLHAVLSASRKVEASWSANRMRRNTEKGFNCNFPTASMTSHKTQWKQMREPKHCKNSYTFLTSIGVDCSASCNFNWTNWPNWPNWCASHRIIPAAAIPYRKRTKIEGKRPIENSLVRYTARILCECRLRLGVGIAAPSETANDEIKTKNVDLSPWSLSVRDWCMLAHLARSTKRNRIALVLFKQ